MFPSPFMSDLEFSQVAQHWANVVLIWIGFGSLAGLLARVVLPVREPSSPLPTLALGIAGSARLGWPFFPGRWVIAH